MPVRAWGLVVSGFLGCAICAGLLQAQELSVVRLPQSTDMTVRLENLTSHNSYEASGNSYFIVPTGRYSVQLLRGGQVAYQEAEFLSSEAPSSRMVNPKQMEIVVGMPEAAPRFDGTMCSALETAARLAVTGYGAPKRDVERRQARTRCVTSEDVEAMVASVAGSYGVTSLGMVGLSIGFTPLAPQIRPRNRGNSPIYKDPATQRLASSQRPESNLTPSLVTDLKNGISDVAVDSGGKPLLVCAAIDANTPLFCDSDGLAVATPAIGRLTGLFRFSVKTTPVDHRGVEVDHWTTFASEDEYQATRGKLESDAEAIRTRLMERIGALEATAGSSSGQRARSYPTEYLVSLINATRAEVDEALRDVTLQPLRQHFSQQYPRVNPTPPFTQELEAQRVFGMLKDIAGVLVKVSGDLGVDLVFRTTPVETEDSRLTFDTCDRCFTVVSQGGEHRFYRGRYYIKTSRDGYSGYEGWLDLVDDPRSVLECELVRVGRTVNGHGSTCSLRAQ